MSKAERTRQLIIEKAALIMNRKGMAGTSISDIMEATKLAKGGVYGNFASKEEICAEAFDYLLNNVSNTIRASLSDKTSAKEQLFSLLDYYKSTPLRQDLYGCPMLNFGTEADDTNPLIKEKVSKAIADSQARIVKIIRKGIEAGEFKPDFDASLFAVKAFSMIEGAVLVCRVQGNSRQMRIVIDILRKEIEEHCL
ncbi:TetR/AcrR family transcriptional regulator [uncultured Chitinophaga sp.]|jgi:Transcriptional regulator|uniref:TetR/AcrR family transcriptional regulator n=1 Tax=uncultured Chitinophaga sp. TaxID=339340 RepID=UPI002620C1C0|nr:TetR/AcrR family transcriptional regulator [uncultured Chitinophaga sp.]